MAIKFGQYVSHVCILLQVEKGKRQILVDATCIPVLSPRLLPRPLATVQQYGSTRSIRVAPKIASLLETAARRAGESSIKSSSTISYQVPGMVLRNVKLIKKKSTVFHCGGKCQQKLLFLRRRKGQQKHFVSVGKQQFCRVVLGTVFFYGTRSDGIAK